MNSFYTNCSINRSNILLKEIDGEGVKRHHKIQWNPTVFVSDNTGSNSTYIGMNGECIKPVKPGTIVETKDFVKKYNDVDGFEIFGQLNYVLQFLGERYPWEIVPETSKLSIWSIDIETRIGDDAFPEPSLAACEIVLITIQNVNTGRCYTFGCKPYNGTDTKYIQCKNETELLKAFISFWKYIDPDIITGWNIETFDIPYIANRIENILGEGESSKLSPWGICKIDKLYVKGNEEVVCSIAGVSILDYLALYKKFTYIKRESYGLKFIAEEELGHTKLDLPGFNFNDNIDNHWEQFTKYNIVDTMLVSELDNKLKLIDVAIALAYKSKINFEDVFSPVKLWDALIVNTLMAEKVVVPQRKSIVKREIEGGYVKEPKIGFYGWMVSLDATSLYPSIMQSLNISPETYLGRYPITLDQTLNDNSILKTITNGQDVCISSIGAMFKRDKQGHVPKLITELMTERKSTKKNMLNLESEYEKTKDSSLTSKIAALNAKQMAIKIAMNSLFGAYAQDGFRFFNPDVAESITLTGQYILKTIEKSIEPKLKRKFGIENENFLIYCDTDSTYFNIDSVVKKYIKDKTPEQTVKMIEKIAIDILQTEVNDICNTVSNGLNFFENKINFKLEAVADKALFIARKKYSMRVHSSEGVTYAKPKLKIVGLELVRSSTPYFIRNKLKDSLNLIFSTDEKTVQNFIKEVKNEFLKLPVDAVAFPRGANNLQEYSDENTIYKKGCPIQVRGALLFNHYVKQNKLTGKYVTIKEGSRIRFFYLKMPNPFKENVLAIPADGGLPPEFNLGEYVDYELQFEKSFLSAMQIMLNPIGWNIEEVSTLDEFFG
jgi:DNA polymerase elongation subunit (family B)